jgi:YHS domain-containing protein
MIQMKKSLFLSLLALSIFTLNSYSQDLNTVRKKHFNLDGELALEGYDPVAYFKLNKAVKGKKELAVFHQGVVYHFSSTENKEEFKKNASRYEPEYGGWCAYAMGAKGEKVSIDPETFKILHGKLYLFYNRAFTNTLKSWNKDEMNLKNKADISWKKIFH